MKFGIWVCLKIRRENSSFIKIRQEHSVLYPKAYLYLWKYLTEFFKEWDKFQTEFVEKIKTSYIKYFPENRAVYEIR